MRLILDIGSGRSLPDAPTAIKLIDEVIKRDSWKHTVIFKCQLFESAPPNVPLDEEVFVAAFHHAKNEGYHLTSSVFDENSLRFLLAFDYPEWPLPFIKIACRPDLYWLIGEIPRRIPVYVSHAEPPPDCYEQAKNAITLMCVRKYPSEISDYQALGWTWANGISDHTVGWDMLKKYKPAILEKHIVLERDIHNPDSGAFAILPEDLEEIL